MVHMDIHFFLFLCMQVKKHAFPFFFQHDIQDDGGGGGVHDVGIHACQSR